MNSFSRSRQRETVDDKSGVKVDLLGERDRDRERQRKKQRHR